jgi:hypothetical protein
MPLQATSGAASYDAFGGGVPSVPQYIEDVFSTYLYTGTGASQTITNNIDLSTKGGMTWIKSRSAAYNNSLFDTARGATKAIRSNLTTAQVTDGNSLTAFNTTGFTLGSGNTTGTQVNTSAATFASWTFRKQPKFFDIVTYSGNGTAARQISHSLGSVPGCIIVMSLTNLYGDPHFVYHRALDATNPQNYFISLNNQDARTASSGQSYSAWASTQPTSTYFTIGDGGSGLNGSGQTYVAYLFAHDAGGFGLTGTDNVISCGSYTGNGSATGPVVTLGYEPQWVLWKNADLSDASWCILDNMRGIRTGSNDPVLIANTDGSEFGGGNYMSLTATGFNITTTETNTNGSGNTIIYIAIRRGPMKVPTTGTSVFAPISVNNSGGTNNTTNFPVDLQIARKQSITYSDACIVVDRLRGVSSTTTSQSTQRLITSTTSAESTETNLSLYWTNTGYQTPTEWDGVLSIYWNFKRAPSVFDEVCYTGTGGTGSRNLDHNLTVAPELLIIKQRSTVGSWIVYNQTIGAGNRLLLQGTNASGSTTSFASTAPTASVFTVDAGGTYNTSSTTFVAYLFATCAGVSKVGSYTGTGAAQTINCGFTGGSRFVLIKRTDSTGDWYVWDSARGIIPSNDPYLLWNTSAAEVTGTDYIDTTSVGFDITSTAPAAINANGGTFIFLAIA